MNTPPEHRRLFNDHVRHRYRASQERRTPTNTRRVIESCTKNSTIRRGNNDDPDSGYSVVNPKKTISRTSNVGCWRNPLPGNKPCRSTKTANCEFRFARQTSLVTGNGGQTKLTPTHEERTKHPICKYAPEQTRFQHRSARATNSLQTLGGDPEETEERCTGDFDAAATVSTTTTTTIIIIVVIMNVRCR